jgi:polysaccharide biosynthesis PFTS motif protein
MSVGNSAIFKYIKFRSLLDRIKNKIQFKEKLVLSYSPSVLTNRLLQVINTELMERFNGLEDLSKDYPFDRDININGIKILPDSSVRIDGYLRIKCFTKFIMFWLLSFVYVYGYGKNKSKEKVCLMYGIPQSAYMNENENEFSDYCEAVQIDSIVQSDHIFVQSSVLPNKVNIGKIHFVRRPLLSAIKNTKIGFDGLLKFFVGHISMLFYFPFVALRYPLLWLLWKDFAEQTTATVLNQKHVLIGVIYTNSNLYNEPLWMTDLKDRDYRTSISLYSLNSHPLITRDSPVDYEPEPCFKLLRADEIFIWLSGYKDMLRRDGLTIMTKVAPPMLWQMPKSAKLSVSRNNQFQITIFAVTPFSDEWLSKKGLDDTYYSYETMKLFIDDIIHVAHDLEINAMCKIDIVHKFKREPSTEHNMSYINHVDRMSSVHQNLHNANYNSSIFDVLSETDVAVVIPFSSVSYVADWCGIPSIFYDPLAILQKDYIKTPLINFVDNRDALYTSIAKLCNNENLLTHSVKSSD